MKPAEPVAVIGLACRFPGAQTPDEFWSLLQRGASAVGSVPPSRWSWSEQAGFPPQKHPAHFQQGGFVEGLEYFDADFFGLSAAEAARLDPQQKLALEVAWQALECACITPATLAGSHTGVIMGVGHGEHALKLKNDHPSYDGKLGPHGYDCFVAHRLSYFFNFKGPSYSVNSACVSSLQAVHLACQSLRSGECDLVLAGGVNVHLAVDETVSCAMAGWLAADGRCKSFSEGGDGYVRGEGCGVVVLKRLADAQRDGDLIWGVLAGSAVGHSGLTSGISWPSGNGQRDVLRRALQQSGLAAAQIDALEAHGSGGAMADRIEASAFTDVLGADRTPEQPLLVGCCKPNIGHLEAAAGLAGLIKLLLCLREGELPAIAGLARVNTGIVPSEAVRLLSQPTPWPRLADRVRRAAVSNFSFGGSNAVLIVEESPAAASAPAAAQTTAPAPASPLPGPQMLVLRARRPGGLAHLQSSLRRSLADRGQRLDADTVHTLNLHRSEFAQRVAYLGDDMAQLDAAFQLDAPGGRVARADFPPALRGAKPVMLLGPLMLGLEWADPTAELQRWFVTARVLAAWQAEGGGFGAAGQARIADFWVYFFHRLGIRCSAIVRMPGSRPEPQPEPRPAPQPTPQPEHQPEHQPRDQRDLPPVLSPACAPGLVAGVGTPPGSGPAWLDGPDDGDLRALGLPPETVFFGPDTAGRAHGGERPVLCVGGRCNGAPDLFRGAPLTPDADWRPGLARLLMSLYCLGSTLEWRWLATGRKTPLITTPFDRQPSWFDPAGPTAATRPARAAALSA